MGGHVNRHSRRPFQRADLRAITGGRRYWARGLFSQPRAEGVSECSGGSAARATLPCRRMFTSTCRQGSRRATPGRRVSTSITGYLSGDAFIDVLRWLWGGIEGGEIRVTPIDGPVTVTAISGESLACTLLADHFAAVNAILAEQEPPAAPMTINEQDHRPALRALRSTPDPPSTSESAQRSARTSRR